YLQRFRLPDHRRPDSALREDHSAGAWNAGTPDAASDDGGVFIMRRKESRIILAVILGLLLFWGGLSVTAEAANGEEETPEAAREMMEDLDFTDVDKMMREIFPD